MLNNQSVALAVHGGAGKWRRDKQDDAIRGVRVAVESGKTVLEAGGNALDAVEEVVRELEDDPTFNAGTGSVLNLDGEVEMDACIMDGSRRLPGAVTAIRDVKNPVSVARMVMEETDHVMLSAGGAQRFARAKGFSSHDCVTEESETVYTKKKEDIKEGEKRYSFPNLPELLEEHPELEKGTVGAVARDKNGCYAAATSTGGLVLKLVGRVGDTPIPGAGTYATENAAASATGQGELVMRMLSTRQICESIEEGRTAEQSTESCVKSMKSTLGCEAGFIAVDAKGDTAALHDTPHMPHARYEPEMNSPEVALTTNPLPG